MQSRFLHKPTAPSVSDRSVDELPAGGGSAIPMLLHAVHAMRPLGAVPQDYTPGRVLEPGVGHAIPGSGESVCRPSRVAAEFAANVADRLGLRAHATNSRDHGCNHKNAAHLFSLELPLLLRQLGTTGRCCKRTLPFGCEFDGALAESSTHGRRFRQLQVATPAVNSGLPSQPQRASASLARSSVTSSSARA